MMTTRSSHARSGRGPRLALSSLLLAFLVQVTGAQAGPGGSTGGNSTDPSTNASSPGDEVTSLPVASDTSGLTLVGTLRELRSLGVSYRGSGRVDVRRLDRHLFAVTFVGDFAVGFDRAALASTGAHTLFVGGRPFQNGLAVLTVGDADPIVLPADRVMLPLSRLAASSRATGPILTLDATGPRLQRTRLVGDFAAARVTVFQRVL